MDTPELWQFTSSHFNEKARWALDFKRVPHIRHSLIPGFHVPVVKRMTGKTHVPVLKLNGTAISDSSRIIEALERAYPEPRALSRRPRGAPPRARTGRIFRRGTRAVYPAMGLSRHPAVPEVCARAFVSHASPAAQLAQRAMSPLIGVGHAAADGYQSRHRRDRARQDDGCDGSIGERATAVGLPGRRSFHGRRSYGGSAAFAAGQAAGVSLQSRGSRFRSRSRKSGTPSRPIPRSDGRFRLIGSIAANRPKSQPRRVSPGRKADASRTATHRGASSRSRIERRPPVRDRTADSPASKRGGDSERDPRSGRAPSAGRWSGSYPPAGNRRRRRHLASRDPPSLRQPRGPGRSDGPAGHHEVSRRNFSKDGRARRNPTSRASSSAFTKSHRTEELRGCSRG